MGFPDRLDAEGHAAARAIVRREWAGGATVEASAPDGITLFEALERQLGLKLVKEKRSIPVVVVDHVDETPLN